MAEQTVDNIIFEGMKFAIIEAFFKQQNYWNPQMNYTTYYGGQAVEIITKVMESPEFKALTDEIQKDLVARKSEFEDFAVAAVKAKAESSLESILKDGSYNSVSTTIRKLMIGQTTNVCREIVESSEPLKAAAREAVEKKIGAGDWDIKITVSVSVTDKPEVV